MNWASVLDTNSSLASAVEHACDQLRAALGGQEPDVLFAFVSQHHSASYEDLPALIAHEFESTLLIGCSGAGVVSSAGEIEDLPSLSLTAGVLPGVHLRATHLDAADLPPVYAEPKVWEDKLRLTVEQEPSFIVLADPASFDAEILLRGLDRIFPAAVKVGGLASGGEHAGSNVVYAGSYAYRSGAVILGLTGDIHIGTIVAQGCKPIGDPMFVTVAHENLIRELDGHTTRDVLANIYERLPYGDRNLFSRSLYLGLALRDDASAYGAGDFLIRSVLGMDPQTGALWINSNVQTNQVVQFHLRDGATSARDLERMLTAYRSTCAFGEPTGALLFSCVGRGTALYKQPDHDTNAFKRLIAEVPIGGLFCAGEIGPVHNATYLHAFTSVFAVFHRRL